MRENKVKIHDKSELTDRWYFAKFIASRQTFENNGSLDLLPAFINTNESINLKISKDRD